MNQKGCPPGQVRQGSFGRCVPGTPGASLFSAIPSRAIAAPPSGGIYPFSNSSGVQATSPAAAAAGPSFSFSFSGTLDASASETENLDFPFSSFSFPMTAQGIYSFTPPDFRTNDGGFGGFGLIVSAEPKNIGFEIQASNPSTFSILIYTNYQPVDPDNVQVTRHDYSAIWPAGNPTFRLTIDSNQVPHLYFDDAEAVLADMGSAQTTITPGNYANVYATAGLPGYFVEIESLKIVGALIPPPTPI